MACCLFLLAASSSFSQAPNLPKTEPVESELNVSRSWYDSLQFDSALVSLSRAAVLCACDSVQKPETYATILYETGRCYARKNQQAAALEAFRQALRIRQRALPPEHIDIARTHRQLSIVLRDIGKYPEALDFGQQALDIQLKTLGPDSFDLASTYIVIGNVFRLQRHYPAAISQYEKAVEVYQKNRPEGDIAFGDVFANLSTVHRLSGNLPLAQQYCEKALQTYRSKHGPDHPTVAGVYMSRGNIHRILADYDQAMQDYQAALTIYAAKFGDESSEAAGPYIGIANVLNLGKSAYTDAEKYYLKALAIYRNTREPDDPGTIGIYNNLGTLYQSIGDLDNARACYEKTLASHLKRFGANHPAVAQTYTNLGIILETKEDFRKALEYYELAMRIQQQAPTPPMDRATTFFRMANAYFQKGDYELSVQYYRKTLEIAGAILPADHPQITGIYMGIGNVHFALQEYDAALEYYQTTLDAQKKTAGDSATGLAGLYLNMGSVYFSQKNYTAAFSNFERAYALQLQKPEEKPLETATILSNLGSAYFALENFERGLKYEKKALDLYRKIHGAEGVDIAASCANLATACKKMGNFPAGLSCFEQAEQALRYRFPFSPEQVLSVQHLMQVLSKKGWFFLDWHAQSNEPAHLHTARQAFAEATKAADIMYRDLHSEKSRSVLLAEIKPVYEGLLLCNYRLYTLTHDPVYAQEAFVCSEKSKSLLLLHALQNTNALHFAGIPDSTLEQEYQLRLAMAYSEKKHQELIAQKTPEADSAMLVWSNRIFDQHRQYDTLLAHINQHYPAYYNLKFNIETARIPAIQERLLPDQTLLEYAVGDSTIFLFVVGKETFHLEKINTDFPLEAWVTDLRTAITTDRSTGAVLYGARAYSLYQKLVAPVRSRLTGALIIVPDGILNYLPFEVLLAEKPLKPTRFQNHQYLLHEHSIGYCYSATLLREMQDKPRPMAGSERLLAIAPYYSGDSALLAELPNRMLLKKRRALRHSGGEVYGIRRIMGGDVLHGNAATKERFLQIAGEYRILHLATHGQADKRAGDNSLLAFAEQADTTDENLLFVRDIYNMALQADLVTLSACETGIGKLQKGEGVISVARAFAYAGAGSIVNTLWGVDDEHTKEFMILFYKELHKGANKSAALQTAKRALAKRPGSHPFFWAAFIGIGDMRPVR
jgi:CHAT domain-containing protein/Tfp pilus assembly protein PilF